MYTYQQQQKLHTFHEHSLGLVRIFEADKQSLCKGVDHGEDHPYLNQLDVGGGWESLADSKKTETFTFFKMLSKSTHNVARTSMTVRLTWTTMSRYSSVKRFTIWLKKISIAVGRFT